VAVCGAVLIDALHPGKVSLRIGQLTTDKLSDLAAAASGQQGFGDHPHLDEPLVEAHDLALRAHHHDSVGRGVQRGLEQRERLAELEVGRLLVGHIVGGHDVPPHRRVVDQIDDGQLERERSEVAVAHQRQLSLYRTGNRRPP
jgi:hypothetical protein